MLQLGTAGNARRVIAKRTLREFWERHPDARQPLTAWCEAAKRADWEAPHQVRYRYRSVSFLPNDRVVFNIKGNTYRLVVEVNYPYRVVYIRFIGTHSEYDRINAAEV